MVGHDRELRWTRSLPLTSFQAAILSPVNYDEAGHAQIERLQRPGFDFIFDPQLYFPQTNCGCS